MQTYLKFSRIPRTEHSNQQARKSSLQHSPIFIFISAARRPPDTGLIHWFPKGPVGIYVHLTFSYGLYQVVCPPCGWTSYAALAGAWSPFENFAAPSAISYACYMSRPLALQLVNSHILISIFNLFIFFLISAMFKWIGLMTLSQSSPHRKSSTNKILPVWFQCCFRIWYQLPFINPVR